MLVNGKSLLCGLAKLAGIGVAIGSTLMFAAPAGAETIIKRPGAHPRYFVELDPHFVLQHSGGPKWESAGYGVGLRATIPFLHEGPIKTINNSMGIGFGGDWAHYSPRCANLYDDRCKANLFVFPVVVQWSFWLTDIISVFGEPGLALSHYSRKEPCRDADGVGECSASETKVRPLLWGGGRFLFTERFGVTVRLGYPSLTVGASLLF